MKQSSYVLLIGLIIISTNISTKTFTPKSILNGLPWLLISALIVGYLVARTSIKLVYALPPYFLLTLLFQRFGDYGYTDGTSWVIFAFVSALYTGLTYLIISQLRKDKQS